MPRKNDSTGSGGPPPLLHTAADGGIVWWTLDCRSSGGYISVATAQALCAAAEAARLDERVSVVVLQAAGDDFCLGFDGGAWEPHVACIEAVAAVPQPVVAAVSGRAFAEGLELALACDLRLAGDGAELALTQLGAGRLPRHGGTQRLPRLVGPSRALELLLSGRSVAAAEAERIGLVSRVAPAASLPAAVKDLARSLSGKGPAALRLAKEAIRAAGDLTLDQGIRLEEDLYLLLQTTRDRREGVRAFLDKRPPRFRGR